MPEVAELAPGADPLDSLASVHKRVVPELVLRASSKTGEGLQGWAAATSPGLAAVARACACLCGNCALLAAGE